MDIVHLMESSMETSRDLGRTYAEIEQTIGLDHSEGKRKSTPAWTSLSNSLITSLSNSPLTHLI